VKVLIRAARCGIVALSAIPPYADPVGTSVSPELRRLGWLRSHRYQEEAQMLAKVQEQLKRLVEMAKSMMPGAKKA